MRAAGQRFDELFEGCSGGFLITAKVTAPGR
jgi:hypothetical protein